MTHKLHWLAMGLLVSLTAQADSLAEAQARYAQEIAECTSITNSDELNTCRMEARNALAEAKRHRFDPTPDSAYPKNLSQRCDVHSGDERAACDARMRGEGRTQGSVSEGGILRESVRPVLTP